MILVFILIIRIWIIYKSFTEALNQALYKINKIINNKFFYIF